MALESNLQTRTYTADADLSASQFLFVKLQGTTNLDVVVCTSAGEQALGVLLNDPDAAGRAATVAVGGVCKVEAGEAIAIGDNISTAADGQAITATTGHVILGIARSAASAAGEIVSVELNIPHAGTA